MQAMRRVWPAVLLLAAVACAGPGPDVPPEARPGAVRMVAVGDSITAADSPDFAAGDLGPGSWVWHVVGRDVAFAGGWAVWGATTADMAAGVEAHDGDVLVVLAGTNDAGVPFSETAANLRSVVRTVGVPDVVLSAVPPIDADPARATRLNDDLADLAETEGWHFVAQPPGISQDGATFAPGMASDGLHPTEEGAAVLGAAIGEVVRRVG